MSKKIKEEKTIKLGNTEFTKGLCKKESYSKFKSKFEGKLKGIDIKEAFQQLGGKIKSSDIKIS